MFLFGLFFIALFGIPLIQILIEGKLKRSRDKHTQDEIERTIRNSYVPPSLRAKG